MIKLELVWMKKCTCCQQEHSISETVKIRNLSDLEEINDNFEKQCEFWLQGHIIHIADAQKRRDRRRSAGQQLWRKMFDRRINKPQLAPSMK